MTIYHRDVDQTCHTSNCVLETTGEFTHMLLIYWHDILGKMKWNMFHRTWAIHLGAVMHQSSVQGQWEIEKKTEKMQKQGDRVGREGFCPVSHQGTKGQVPNPKCPSGTCARHSSSGFVCFTWGFSDFCWVYVWLRSKISSSQQKLSGWINNCT